MKRRTPATVTLLVIAALLVLSLARPAEAVTLTEYPIPTPGSSPSALVAGPDGNIWFAEQLGNKIGRITPLGVITEFPLPTANSGVFSLTVGPDGNLWFAESYTNRIGRLTPDGVLTEFPVEILGPHSIIAGRDGNLWFGGSYERIGKITTAGVVTEYRLPSEIGYSSLKLAADAEGNIWYLRQGPSPRPTRSVGRLSPAGEVVQTNLGTFYDSVGVGDIGTGPDGNIWYTLSDRGSSRFVRLTSNGATSPAEIRAPFAPSSFVSGTDGNFWFAAGTSVGKLTLGGATTLYATNDTIGFGEIAEGRDGNFWLTTSFTSNAIAKFTLDRPNSLVVARASNYGLGTVAPDSIAVLFGNSLAAATESATSLPLPTVLSGVSVKVRVSSGTERAAPLFFASPSQINFLIPAGTPLGNATVSVIKVSGEVVNTGTVIVDSVAAGLFSADATGQGLAAAVVLRVRADGSQVYEPIAQRDANNNLVSVPIDLSPATDQVYLILFGSGLRGYDSSGNIRAYFDSGSLTLAWSAVLYLGAQGSLSGLDQVNLPLPSSLAGRGEIVVYLQEIAGRALSTNRVKIEIK